MDSLRLEFSFPKKSPSIPSLDPEPNWDLSSLTKELKSLEMQHEATSYSTPIRGWNLPTVRTKNKKGTKKNTRHMANYDSEESESTSEEEERVTTPVSQNRFSCNDLSLSDSDEELINELPKEENVLLNKPSIEEFLLLELNREHLLEVQERARSTLKTLDMRHSKEMERLASRFGQINKYAEARKEVDRRQDMEYQRNVAEIVDRHLSAVQWDHEQRSRIMERKLRDDAAALEEAKRLERARIEEKLRKEKAQQEAEARQKAAQEAAKKEAERKRAEELEAAKKREEANTQVVRDQGNAEPDKESPVTSQPQNLDKEKNNQLPGVKVLAAPAALEAEAKRLKLRSEIPEMALLTKELGKYDRRIAKCISKLLPTIDNVRTRSQELIAAINDPQCPPRPFTYCMLANKVVSLCRDRNSKDKTFEGTAFACGYLVLLVTSQFPDAMDYILAEFNRVCIYTVPKYLRPSDASARTKQYYKMIGYHEEDEKLESTEAYVTYVSAYVKLYAAIIQSEIEGVNKPYGLNEGWKWIAMCLNRLPATTSTAVALEAFLKMAGFALYMRYRSQFKKILDVIANSFLPALKQLGTKAKAEAVTNLEYYITGQLYLKEPEGRHLATGLLSRDLAI